MNDLVTRADMVNWYVLTPMVVIAVVSMIGLLGAFIIKRVKK